MYAITGPTAVDFCTFKYAATARPGSAIIRDHDKQLSKCIGNIWPSASLGGHSLKITEDKKPDAVNKNVDSASFVSLAISIS
jgi:hypothetical protein